jgi:hypothetical protein
MKKSNLFNHHLRETNENYFEHFTFVFGIGVWIVLAGLILIIHAIIPFILTKAASTSIKKINEVLQKRRDDLSKRGIEIDNH